MATHRAVVSVAIRAPLGVINVPTIEPAEREVQVRVEWTASTPFDLHQNDGGLLVDHPYVLGDNLAGTVIKLGPGVEKLRVGDKVFGFGWRKQQEKPQQEIVTIPEFLLGKIPPGFSSQEAVTLCDNLVTTFHALTADLSLPLPWPRPPHPSPLHASSPILIWGGSSSCGQYAIQVLHHWGYANLLTTASKTHHAHLRTLGATQCFDYRDKDVAAQILKFATRDAGARQDEPAVPFIYDCIASKAGSLASIAKVAQRGARVAVLLPVIVRDATETEAPAYAMDTQAEADWAPGVETRGVRTHFYLENEFFKEHLQATIMPAVLAEGIVKPNRQRVVEGKTLLDRAQKAMDALRRKEVSGERLVWRVCEEREV